MATQPSSRRTFGVHLLPALRSLNAGGLRVVSQDGDSLCGSLPPQPLRRVTLRRLRFRLL